MSSRLRLSPAQGDRPGRSARAGAAATAPGGDRDPDADRPGHPRRSSGRRPGSGPISRRMPRHFARRKSSIYRGQPPFAIFGIGPYSFAPVQGGRLGSAQDAAIPRDRAGRGTAGHARRHLLLPRLPDARAGGAGRRDPRRGGGPGLPPLPDLPGRQTADHQGDPPAARPRPRSPPAPIARRFWPAPTRSAAGCSAARTPATRGRAVRLARGPREPAAIGASPAP